jgi:hypothetical protein
MQSITYIRWDGPDVLVSRELSDIALTPVSGYSGRPVLGDHSVETFSTR